MARDAGITYQWSIAGKRPLNVLQTIGNGCAFLDYDNDGNLDVLLVGRNPALYRGDGKGHFTDVSQSSGLASLSGKSTFLGCATGDFDGDGFVDIYLGAYRGGTLLHNERGQRFTDVTRLSGIAAQPWATSCAFVDVDGDGRLDLYIGNYAKFGPNIEPQLCEYSGHMSACGPRFYDPEAPVLYRNLGGGRFTDVTSAWGVRLANGQSPGVTGKALGIACADFDGSGRQSIALANDEVAGDLLRNTGKSFDNIGPKSGTAYDSGGNVHGGMGVDWGDYDNDGKLDLVVATFQHEPKSIYHNEGGGQFSELSSSLEVGGPTAPNVAFGVKWLDLDNDGWLDVIFANGHVQDNIDQIDRTTTYRQPLQLFRNRGGKNFEDLSLAAGPDIARRIVGRGLAVGDYDNDGKMDVLVVDAEGSPLLLHNETKSSGHWIGVRLVTNRAGGLGSLLTLKAGGKSFVRQCQSAGSYMSASDIRVHFGLGSERTAQSLTIRWPGGKVQKFAGLAADRYYTLTEGSSSAR